MSASGPLTAQDPAAAESPSRELLVGSLVPPASFSAAVGAASAALPLLTAVCSCGEQVRALSDGAPARLLLQAVTGALNPASAGDTWDNPEGCPGEGTSQAGTLQLGILQAGTSQMGNSHSPNGDAPAAAALSAGRGAEGEAGGKLAPAAANQPATAQLPGGSFETVGLDAAAAPAAVVPVGRHVETGAVQETLLLGVQRTNSQERGGMLRALCGALVRVLHFVGGCWECGRPA